VLVALALTFAICALPAADAPVALGATASQDARDVALGATDAAVSTEAVRLDRRDTAPRLDDRVTWLAVLVVALTWRVRASRLGVIGGRAARFVVRWVAGSTSPRAPPAEWVVRGRSAPRPLTLLQS
jgi:hypothetical protein